MLLSKTDNRAHKRQSGSKTRSITEKQLSFKHNSRLPSQSQVLLQGIRTAAPMVQLPSSFHQEEDKDFEEENED